MTNPKNYEPFTNPKNYEITITCPVYHKRYELEDKQNLICPACGGIHGKDDLMIVVRD